MLCAGGTGEQHGGRGTVPLRCKGIERDCWRSARASPLDEIKWECAGVNHLAWFTKFEHNGEDLYPLLFKKAKADLAGKPSDPDDAKDLVRKDMMIHFGAYITESSGHLSEYLPYYRKRKDLIAQYCRDGYDGGSSFYANNWPQWRADADTKRVAILKGKEPRGLRAVGNTRVGSSRGARRMRRYGFTAT